MEDKLRDFVQSNKNEFDNQKAPTHIWNKIENELGPAKPKRDWKTPLWLLIFLVIGMLISFVATKYLFSNKTETPTHYAIKDKTSAPLRTAVDVQHVNTSRQHAVLKELNDLDEGFKELEADFSNKPGNSIMMMKLMKKNYELRIKILDMAIENEQKIDHSDFIKHNGNEY